LERRDHLTSSAERDIAETELFGNLQAVWIALGANLGSEIVARAVVAGAIQRFHTGVKNSRVIELCDTNHYLFITDEALVVREMRKFLLEE